MMDTRERIIRARKVTLIGFIMNIFLTAGKLFAGYFGKSAALIADGIHSLSDLLTDLIVLVFIDVSGKGKDSNHKYGHGKFETFATMLVSFALMMVGIGIFWSGLKNIIHTVKGEIIEQPGLIALIVAVTSIIIKEVLFWYTYKTGGRISSKVIIANAWHHRSDALSSIGVTLGVSCAIFLGESWRILDPVASILVSFFIVKVAWNLGKPSVGELLESSLPPEEENEIKFIIESVPGVKNHHNLMTRRIGNIMAVEVNVEVDKNLSVEASHEIATEIEMALRNRYGKQTHIGVHIEPFYE